ncbi:MAG: aminotransferase class I/II-fold pyridoxal phosphate-dependent enzyme [Legionellaceae bacterium]|nr:aminotransferase class I/II-fold pyridoxal phosphate-dependent enzyme [Legionellaceae bacterium]
MLKPKLKAYVKNLECAHLKRTPKRTPKHHLNFSSNDYLGLATQPEIQAAYQAGFQQNSVGSTGSMLVSGYHETHEALEYAFKRALGVDAARLFPSGYTANLGVMQLLATLNIHALIDKQMHASIYDGLRLSGGRYTRYYDAPKPNVPDAIVLTEGIFSMRGNMPDLTQLANHYPLIVDEAHSFGILGPSGLGSVTAHRLTQDEVPLRIIPFGKALGAAGAIVLGDNDWITALTQTARPFIYSTAMSPAMAHGLRYAFQHLQAADTARKALQQNIVLFKQHITHSPLVWADTNTPIQQLRLGSPKLAIQYAAYLEAHNIYCIPMREPTVRRTETGLRIVLNHCHTPDNIHYLFECLHQCHRSI